MYTQYSTINTVAPQHSYIDCADTTLYVLHLIDILNTCLQLRACNISAPHTVISEGFVEKCVRCPDSCHPYAANKSRSNAVGYAKKQSSCRKAIIPSGAKPPTALSGLHLLYIFDRSPLQQSYVSALAVNKGFVYLLAKG